MATIDYQPHQGGFRVTLVASMLELSIEGKGLDDTEPVFVGAKQFRDNIALMALLLGYAANELAFRRSRSKEKKESHERAAAHERKEALALADMITRLERESTKAWCSGCFSLSGRHRVQGASRPAETWLCDACGTSTVGCAVPRCKHHAVIGPRAKVNLAYCAEHQHDIPSFEKLEATIPTLADYEDFLRFEVRNAKRITQVTGGMIGAAVVVAPMALLAAPAVGAALGSSALGGSLTGAAATSHGLAMLGGGAIAQGGLGMAGGTMVVTATGTALGGALGASTMSSYIAADPSFRIEKVREGVGTPVVFATGFLTQGLGGWEAWRVLVDSRYPDAPIYQVHWGAKELKNLGELALSASTKAVVQKMIVAGAKRGSKAAGMPGVGWVLGFAGIATNPWTVARTRAGMTGVALGTLLARCEEGPFVLMGHSLGGRVMATAAQTLSTKPGGAILEDVHLLGAAIGRKGDWRGLNDAVTGQVWNYWSKNDDVLRWLYKLSELGETAVGQAGFASGFARIKDRNVSQRVAKHSDYVRAVRLEKSDRA